MAVVARMVPSEVTQRLGTVWELCDEGDEGAQPLEKAFENYYYGVPFWLRGPNGETEGRFVRQANGLGAEQWKMTVVRSGGPDDPNNEFFTASPNGSFEMTVENPRAMGQIKVGREYRVTIEEIRGPRQRDA